MKAITQYKTDDGTIYTTEAAALAHERLSAKIQKAMEPLKLTAKTNNNVRDGKGWVQHRIETVIHCRDSILDLCCDEGFAKSFPVFKHRGAKVHPMSIIARILNDNGGPLDVVWNRFCRIDEKGREHQQAYYAMNGHEEGQVCVEDLR